MRKIFKPLVLILSSFLLICCSSDEEIDQQLIDQNGQITASDLSVTVPENPSKNQFLGTIDASVPEGSLRFEITSQTPGMAMEIDSQNGDLMVADTSLFDFEIHSEIVASIEVSSDFGARSVLATVDLTDIMEKGQGFITTWRTDSEGESIVIPSKCPLYNCNYSVYWGDGTVSEDVTESIGHTYDSPGTYTVEIIGDFPGIHFLSDVNTEQIRTVEQWGDIEWKSMAYAFSNCINLTYNATDAPDLSQVTEMQFMFFNAKSFNGNLNNWDVRNINDMSRLFDGASSFNGDISDWNVSSVSDMSIMFSGAIAFNGDLSDWNVSNVKNMSSMFAQAFSFNQDISKWNVQRVEDMGKMFFSAKLFDRNLGNWNLSGLDISKAPITHMLSYSGMSTSKYDSTLWGWSQRTNVPRGLLFIADDLEYCDLGETARDILIVNKAWRIWDDKKASTEDCN